MVQGEQFVITADERRSRRIEAVYAHEEAKDERNRLILELKAIAKRAVKVVALLEAIEINPEFPLQSEAPLLMLTQRDYEGLDFTTVRALATAVAASRKAVAETAEVRRIQG